jgi:hypothetical protein
MMRISLPKQEILYTEGEQYHLYMAVVRLDNGNGDLISVVATDEFMAGVLAKMLPQVKKVLFIIQFTNMLERLQLALAETEPDSV